MLATESRCALRALTLVELGRLIRVGEPDDAGEIWGHTVSVERVVSALTTRGS